jgi:hypothetical protein
MGCFLVQLLRSSRFSVEANGEKEEVPLRSYRLPWRRRYRKTAWFLRLLRYPYGSADKQETPASNCVNKFKEAHIEGDITAVAASPHHAP